MSAQPLQVQFDPASARFGASRSQKRLEDERLLTGKGRYSDDLEFPGECWLVLVRSPHAHARIGAIDLTAVKGAPGVIAAWTMAELRADGGAAAHAARRRQGVLRRPAGGGDRRRDARAGAGRGGAGDDRVRGSAV